MVGSSGAKTIESRFNDFTLGEDMPRFITCQDLGKLMLEFHNFTWETPTNTLNLDADDKAILKRCIFVEAIQKVVKPESKDAREKQTEEKKKGLWESINSRHR